MNRVLVIGATGMLGSMVYQWLSSDPSVQVVGTGRGGGGDLRSLDAEHETPDLHGVEWAINCVGVIKPYVRDNRPAEVRRAIRINALFPMRLAEAAEATGARVIQIATDCVFRGVMGPFSERSPHDATDAYGKTKSLGEVASPRVTHLRCSIVGPERRNFVSLLEWLLRHPPGATVNGFTNHLWNGITTLHFAKLCHAIICGRADARPAVWHVIPSDEVSKAELLRCFVENFGRRDLVVRDVEAPESIDRRLATVDGEANDTLWRAAGYAEVPTVRAMVQEMADYCRARAWPAAGGMSMQL